MGCYICQRRKTKTNYSSIDYKEAQQETDRVQKKKDTTFDKQIFFVCLLFFSFFLLTTSCISQAYSWMCTQEFTSGRLWKLYDMLGIELGLTFPIVLLLLLPHKLRFHLFLKLFYIYIFI